jgi:Family of unknown function (DUF5681)
MAMGDEVSPKPPGRARGRPFEKGRSGNPGGRRRGSRNGSTLAAAALLAGESEALTRKAVEAALAGDSIAMRLCLERVLPRCQERPVEFCLPPIATPSTAKTSAPTPRDLSRAMNAVTSAVARGEITPGEAATIAGVVDTFMRAIAIAGKADSGLNLLQILTADDDEEDDFEDEADDYEEIADFDQINGYGGTDDLDQ